MNGPHFAINIADLHQVNETDPIPVQFMVAPAAPGHYHVNAEPKNLDGAALLLDVEPERARAVVDIIRTKYPRHQVRCYTSKNLKTWKRI